MFLTLRQDRQWGAFSLGYIVESEVVVEILDLVRLAWLEVLSVIVNRAIRFSFFLINLDKIAHI